MYMAGGGGGRERAWLSERARETQRHGDRKCIWLGEGGRGERERESMIE